MKPHVLPFLALSLAAAARPSVAPVRIVYAPRAGAEVEREVSSRVSFTSDDLEAVMNGAEIPREFLPDLTVDVQGARTLSLVDRIERAADGRPLHLRRTFTDAREESTTEVTVPPAPTETHAREGRSPLVGKELAFDWDPAASRYDVSLAAGGGDAESLDGLEEDLDLRALLPRAAVEPGDEWDVDGSFLHELEFPGGTWPVDYEGSLAEDDPFRPETAWTGKAHVRFTGWDDAEEGRVALLELRGDAERERTREGSLEEVPVVDGTATEDVSGRYTFTGSLRWDVDAGLMRDFAFDCDVSLLFVTVKDPGQPGPDYEHSIRMSGEWDVRFAARPHAR